MRGNWVAGARVHQVVCCASDWCLGVAVCLLGELPCRKIAYNVQLVARPNS